MERSKIIKRAGEFQASCHRSIEVAREMQSRGSYEDITNVWFFMKIAEMELRIDQLEENKIEQALNK